ncbi:MAG: zinc-ribbon domain-containing protein, partial [Pirellulaceae bacterium]
MRKFECRCGNALFFKNSLCVACQCEVGWCPVCRAIQTLIPDEGQSGYRCGNPDCLAPLRKCHNYQVEQ